jgi:hypothetical protein
VANFAGQGPVPHDRRGLLETFKLLVDPAASRDLGNGGLRTNRASRYIADAWLGACTRPPFWLQPERPAHPGCDRREGAKSL